MLCEHLKSIIILRLTTRRGYDLSMFKAGRRAAPRRADSGLLRCLSILPESVSSILEY